LLTFVPYAEGVEFDPPRRSFQWLESVHTERFQLRAGAALAGRTIRGRITVYLGSLIIADIGLVLKVGTGARGDDEEPVRQAARPYRRIFASYSHRDRAIVDEFSQYARAIGDRYVKDVIDLRAGERWQERLAALISEADVFQLVLSWAPLEAACVRSGWGS